MKVLLTFLVLLWAEIVVAQEEGKDYFLHSIYFGGGSYYIDELAEEGLYEFLQGVKNIENFAISIHGHTDNIGSAAYNKYLAEMRSEAVIRLLENWSIDRDLISKKDFGKYNPLYDNSTWQGRNLNRRVDVILWPISM